MNGRSRFSWRAACDISYAFGIPLRALLIGDEDAIQFSRVRPLPLAAEARRQKWRKPRIILSDDHLRFFVNQVRLGNHPSLLTLDAVAASLGIVAKTLCKRLPEESSALSIELTARRRSQQARRRDSVLFEASEAALQVASDLAKDGGNLTRREIDRRLAQYGVRLRWRDSSKIGSMIRTLVHKHRRFPTEVPAISDLIPVSGTN